MVVHNIIVLQYITPCYTIKDMENTLWKVFGHSIYMYAQNAIVFCNMYLQCPVLQREA